MFSQQTNLNTSTTQFLFNLVTTHVLHLWSLLLAHLPGPLWKSLITLFGMLHLVYTTNFPNSHWSSRASSDIVSFTFTYHTWQFIIFTTLTITACIFLLLLQSFILDLRLGSSVIIIINVYWRLSYATKHRNI